MDLLKLTVLLLVTYSIIVVGGILVLFLLWILPLIKSPAFLIGVLFIGPLIGGMILIMFVPRVHS